MQQRQSRIDNSIVSSTDDHRSTPRPPQLTRRPRAFMIDRTKLLGSTQSVSNISTWRQEKPQRQQHGHGLHQQARQEDIFPSRQSSQTSLVYISHPATSWINNEMELVSRLLCAYLELPDSNESHVDREHSERSDGESLDGA